MNPKKTKFLLEILGKKPNKNDPLLNLINDEHFEDFLEKSNVTTTNLEEQMALYFKSIEIPKDLKKKIMNSIQTKKKTNNT